MLTLAAVLRDIDRDTAPDGLRERTFPAQSVTDDFELAEALLRPDSLAAALRVLDRTCLALLRFVEPVARSQAEVLEQLGSSAAEALALCERRFLIVRRGDVLHGLPEVAAELDRSGVPQFDVLARPEGPVAIARHSVDTSLLDRRASEAATRVVFAVASLVTTLTIEPARELAKGGLALPDVKRIAEAARIELELVGGVLNIANLAGLVCGDGRQWVAAVESREWLSMHVAARWERLARAWWRSLSVELRSAAATVTTEGPREEPGMTRFRELLEWRYPAAIGHGEALSELVATATTLGVVAGAEFSVLGRALAADASLAELEQTAAELFPAEVSTFYVQPDYSIIVPGPPEPELDRTLRSFADCEQADLASTYRVSASSLNRALTSGASIREVREFLLEHSLTGIPQPLEYVLSQAGEQFGRVRVRVCDEPPIQAAVRVLDPHLLDVLRVDHAVHALAFVVRGPELVTRASAAHTLTLLESAKYPAALEDADGVIIPLEPTFGRAPTRNASVDPVQAMWTRVRAARADQSDETAWLSRQILVAVKSKARMRVEVRLPSGGTTEYLLEPTGLAGNRMRARDRKADIERTLPLSSIVSVTLA